MKRGQIFTKIYKSNYWPSLETPCGPGSTLEYTEQLRRELPDLLRSLKIKKLLDIPCGDFHWMQHVDLSNIEYTGGDIVKELIEKNKAQFPQQRFIHVDLIQDTLPYADLLLCRDCFIHLNNKDVLSVIRKIKKTGIPYILTNTYPETTNNTDIRDGGYRMINLQQPPFNFPSPVTQLKDYIKDYPIRYLGLWKTADLKV